MLELRDYIRRWLDHIEGWAKYDASEPRGHTRSYARAMLTTLRQMAWAIRGLDSRRSVEDLRNELLRGITFFATVIANSRNEERRTRPTKEDRKRARSGATQVIGTIATMDPHLAKRLRVDDVANVILRRADLATRVSGKRSTRTKDSGYLEPFARLWQKASGVRVSAATIRTSLRRSRTHRSMKSAVPKRR